jgi:hypothetical protein
MVVFAVGLLIGLVVGRWWALLAAVAWGVYVAAESEVELPPGVLALFDMIVAAAGIAAGVMIRRRLAK